MLLTLCALQNACTLGYNRMLFMTKTNVGLDVDSRPPTAEVSIARREGFIGPSFEEGKALPVFGGFRLEGNWFSPKISGAFAGGKAAIALARFFDDNTTDDNTTRIYVEKLEDKICLSQKPANWNPGILNEEGFDARPFFFATDTTFGLKVAWSGASEAVPDSFKMGYNRKEFAYAPVFGRQGNSGKNEQCGSNEYQINIPSFIATIQNDVTIATLVASNLIHVQFFATGEAAVQLSARPKIRKWFARPLNPNP